MLAAAEKRLRSRGADAITTRKVAADVGVTAMALYRHFRNKEALLAALVQAGFERWETRLAKAATAKTPLAQIENAFGAYRDFALEEPRYFELMFLIPRRRVPIAPKSLAVTTSPSFALLIEAVRQAMANGTLMAGEPAQLILMMWSTAHGLLALHFSGRFGFDDRVFSRQYDHTMLLLLSSVRGPSR